MSEGDLELIKSIADNDDDFGGLNENASFLEVIRKTYEETFISRMLAYTFEKDEELVGKFIEFAGEHSSCIVNKTVRCEKVVPGGRIDIFVEAQDSSGKRYTITIENKINSKEHGNQTDCYYNYVNRYYGDCKNMYFYLTPEYNCNGCKSEWFRPITYKQLYLIIGNNDDDKVADFKKHIKKYFYGEKIRMKEVHKKILENYGNLKRLMSEADEAYEVEKQQLFSTIKTKLGVDEKGWKTEVKSWESSGNSSYRIYKENWYHNDDDKTKKFYFYAELLYVDNDPNEICVQGTVKTYGRNKKNIRFVKFIQDEQYAQQYVINKDPFYILYQEPFSSQTDMYSDEWKSELEKFAIENIGKAIEKADQVFKEFNEYIKQSEKA